jgi:ubiquinone/menaquinone biosynthesis C-methylase UbiE
MRRGDARHIDHPMLFKRQGEAHALSIAMTGVKLGDRLLQIGCSDGSLLTAVSSKVGMSGRACLLATTEAEAARAARSAARAGVLLEVTTTQLDHFPYEDRAFDLIVIDSQDGLLGRMKPEQRVAALQQARRTLAPRGRIVIIERAPRAGLGALLTRTPIPLDSTYLKTGGAETALRAEGFKGVRQLAERDGLSFFEGIT